MTRNYTTTRTYLLQPENIRKTLCAISNARSETWKDGWSTSQLEGKYKKTSSEMHKIYEEIREKIDRIEDEKLRIILTKRYLEFKSGAEIERITGWSAKFVKNLHQRALMNMEIILLEDGILTFVNPQADMMADYEDGFRKGKREGYVEGRAAGYEDGYDEGYERGEEGLPYDKSEDEEDDYDEDDDYYDEDDDYLDFCNEEDI